jgi:hypothetical protein
MRSCPSINEIQEFISLKNYPEVVSILGGFHDLDFSQNEYRSGKEGDTLEVCVSDLFSNYEGMDGYSKHTALIRFHGCNSRLAATADLSWIFDGACEALADNRFRLSLTTYDGTRLSFIFETLQV